MASRRVISIGLEHKVWPANERKMATTSLSSTPSRVSAKLHPGGISRSPSSYTQLTFCIRQPLQKAATAFHRPPPELLLSPRKHARTCPATDNDQAAAAQETTTSDTPRAETSVNDNAQPGVNGSPPQPLKRPTLPARERLRAARVLGKYAEPSASKAAAKPEFGSRVLDALRETDKAKGKKRSGLPEAPSNLFDDSKRGMPKEGWTFELPVGTDVLVIVVSFVVITTIMLGTTFLVWKLGAIHFNEF